MTHGGAVWKHPGAVGAIFLFSAGLGMLRMPDVYHALQAGTKASTLGNILVLTGLAFYHPGWSLKLLIVDLFRAPHQSDFLARVGPRCPRHPGADDARDRDRRAR